LKLAPDPGWPFPVTVGIPLPNPESKPMTFALETPTKTKITDVVVLSQKNRTPGDNPGAALSFSMLLANEHLSYFDGSLKSFLYTKSAASSQGQAALDGVEPVSDMPNLTSAGGKVGKLHWKIDLTGYELTIDYGTGGPKSNVVLADSALSGFVFTPKEGGSFQLDFDAESQDVPEKVFGKLATLKNTEVSILLTPPEVVQEQIE